MENFIAVRSRQTLMNVKKQLRDVVPMSADDILVCFITGCRRYDQRVR